MSEPSSPSFSKAEKKNITLYILGIMAYKFGLEAFNGSIIILAVFLFAESGYSYSGLMLGLSQAFQCVGSIAIAPLVKRFSTPKVLVGAIITFSILSSLHMIIDGSTGGTWPLINETESSSNLQAGNWNPFILLPFYCLVGICFGMVELIRRIIPRDIVGGDSIKLKKMDSLVHVFYEVSGTLGALLGSLLVYRLGANYAAIITPPFYIISGICWYFIDIPFEKYKPIKEGMLWQIWGGLKDFAMSLFKGGSIIFSSRKFMWLIPGYSIPLYTHRYLENGLNTIFAREIIKQSAYSQIMTGGSNFGELLGALFVFFFANKIKTPIPWLRLDAITLLVVWILPFFPVINNDALTTACVIALIWAPVSFGWAAGDVSLAAYIQSRLADDEEGDESGSKISPLGAVMSFLYVLYIVIYAILSYTLGLVVDTYKQEYINQGVDVSEGIRVLLQYLAGVQYTIVAAIILGATFIPKNSCSLNPNIIDDNKYSALNEDGEELV